MRVIRVLLVSLGLAATAGCATTLKGTSQKVPMSSDPPGAEILVDGTLVGSTPMDVELKRKRDHLVTLQKAGYSPKSVAVVKDVGGAVWGNILLGGLIGWGVDAATGAQYNLTPKSISVELVPNGSVPPDPAKDDDQATFVAKLNTLDELKEKKQISDEEYSLAKLKLLRHYMPEALPDDVRDEPPKEPTSNQSDPSG